MGNETDINTQQIPEDFGTISSKFRGKIILKLEFYTQLGLSFQSKGQDEGFLGTA